jgi:hypothetical protein
MQFFKCCLFLLSMLSSNIHASQLLPFIKSLNDYLEPQGLKIQEYRPSNNEIKGYKLNFVITKPEVSDQYETIKNIYINESLNTAIIVYKKELINSKLNDLEHVELVDSFSKFFKRIDDKYYPNSPLFKEPHKIPFSDDLMEFHNSKRSFIIDKSKTFITSSTVLFFNGEELSEFSKSKIDSDNFLIREKIKSVYESQEQITFIPNDMENLAVIFFSKALESATDIFKVRDIINKNKLGLLFLPYLDIQTDMNTSKDYQLFCQEDFDLTIELAMLGDLQQEFQCPDSDRSTQKIIEIYKARDYILNFYHIDFTKPYYYFYKEMKLIDYEYFKSKP